VGSIMGRSSGENHAFCGDTRTSEVVSVVLQGTSNNIEGGLPPEKWSSLMYGLWPEGGLKNGKEATHGGRDRHQASAG
jgi:hypothetical protein